MKRFFFSFWLTILIAASVQVSAAPVLVRSGEHADFTRLVMRLPPGTTWVSEPLEGSITLTFDGVVDGFETSRVFEVIPRTRIREITSSANSIDIIFSCKCEAKIFLEAGNYLVVDVSEANKQPSVQTRDEDPRPRTAVSSFGYGDLIWGQPDDSLNAEGEKQSSEIDTDFPAVPNLPSYEQSMRPHLLSAIGNAASRGVLRMKSSPQKARDTLMEMHRAADEETEGNRPERHPREPSVPADHVKISSSSELAPTEEPSNLSMSGDNCPRSEILSFSQGELNASFSEQVGLLRSTLYDSRDRLHEESVQDLARLYLKFGFGAEARATISLAPTLIQQNLALLGVADVLEDRAKVDLFVFAGFEGCDSDWALWSFLASGEVGDDRVVNDTAILRALTALPEHLRNALARRVSDKFLELGKTEAAALALRNLQNMGHLERGSPNLTEVNILRAQQENAHTVSLLSELANSSTRDSPLALIELVREAVDKEQVLNSDLALLADTYAFEFRDSPLGMEMLETQVLASALSGQFKKAFTLFYRIPADIPAVLSRSLLSDVFGMLVRQPDDIVFLEFALSKTLSDDLGSEFLLRDRIAKRLIALGFPQQGYALIAQTGATSQDYSESSLVEQSGSLEHVLELPVSGSDLEFLTSSERPAADGGPQGSDLRATEQPAKNLATSPYGDENKTAFADLNELTRTRLESDPTQPETISVFNALLSRSEADRLELVRILSEIPRP